MTLPEAQRGKLLFHGTAQLRNQLLASRGKVLAGAQHRGFELLQLAVEPRQLGIPLFETYELARGPAAKLDHVGDRWTVLALERLEQIQPLLQFAKAGRIDFNTIR